MPDRKDAVTMFIYKPELKFLKWLVLQKPKIETGGDLFGLWQDERTAVVQFISGPGKECRRTTTSFHQDVDHLAEVGGYLTTSHGLCNIGEWHSHHTLGLAEPSAGDQRTVWNHLPSVSGGRFLVLIANIRGNPAKVEIGCFIFNGSKREMLAVKIACLKCPSPVRQLVKNTQSLTWKNESGQDWSTFMNRGSPNISTTVEKGEIFRKNHSGSSECTPLLEKSSTSKDGKSKCWKSFFCCC